MGKSRLRSSHNMAFCKHIYLPEAVSACVYSPFAALMMWWDMAALHHRHMNFRTLARVAVDLSFRCGAYRRS